MDVRVLIVSLALWGASFSSAWAESTHVVRKNETLSGIAKRYGVSVASLQQANNIRNAKLLAIGKKLIIPAGVAREATYVVRPGDSLGVIAARYGVKVNSLATRNRLARPDLIRVGQTLTIPLRSGSARVASPLLDSGIKRQLDAIRPTPGKWKRIIIHHSATNVDDAVNIHQVHKRRGMSNGLAYHFVISNGSRKAKDGEIYIGGRWKQQQNGGHVKKESWNRNSIGICLIGNFETRHATAAQMKTLEALCRYLMGRSGLTASAVTTHKGLHPGHTLCPGKHFPETSFKAKLARPG
jgi:LysM repeat protein